MAFAGFSGLFDGLKNPVQDNVSGTNPATNPGIASRIPVQPAGVPSSNSANRSNTNPYTKNGTATGFNGPTHGLGKTETKSTDDGQVRNVPDSQNGKDGVDPVCPSPTLEPTKEDPTVASPEIQFELGMKLLKEHPSDLNQAIGLLHKAADQDFAEAHFQLGKIYDCLLYTSPSPRDS